MSKTTRTFFTGLIPLLAHEQQMRTVRGRGWMARLKTRPGSIQRSDPAARKEVVILAKTIGTAERAFHLILTAHRLIHSEPPPLGDDHLALLEAGNVDPEAPGSGTSHTAHYPTACQIAAKASRRREFVYALSLYRLSQSLHANAVMDLDPRHYPLLQRSPYPIDHARLAYAIVTAYAVIEQLGLALRDEAFKDKQWIPEKRRELEERLRHVGVELNEPILWQIRGGRTKLEASWRRNILRRAAWAVRYIRDAEIEIVDAVAEVRWLRSGIAAHKMDKLAGAISIHDVSNAQHLARRLILDSLGATKEWVAETR